MDNDGAISNGELFQVILSCILVSHFLRLNNCFPLGVENDGGEQLERHSAAADC